MKLSIVIPAHNGARFLREALDAALNQLRRADEIIVVDDASSDDTAGICRSPGYGGKITYHYNAVATGFVDAWNRAVDFATGDYVTILHQDDLLAPEYLLEVQKALQRFPHALHLYAPCEYVDSQGKRLKGAEPAGDVEATLYSGREYARKYLRGVEANRHLHRCPGVTTSRALLQRCRYRKEAGHIADDDFFLRVGAFTEVVGLSGALARYRHHLESATEKLESMALRLARDWVFQAEYHRSHPTLLDAEDLDIIDRLVARLSNLLLFQGCCGRRDDWVAEALRLSAAHQRMAPGVLKGEIPPWARPLWALARFPATRPLADCYASTLKAAHAALQNRRIVRC